MEIKWIKLDTGLFDNRKIKQIRTLPEGDSLVVIWLQLMCLAGTVNDNGMVYFTKEIPYTEQMLATAFDEPQATVQLALKVFKQFGMIDVIDDIIYISNWEKYQAVDAMEKAREQTRKRVSSYRERQKQLCNVTGNVTVTDCNALDKDKELEKENTNTDVLVQKKSTTKRFTKPTVNEIEAYGKDHGYEIDAERFYDFYESKGWLVGKSPMKDWKAAVRNWAKADKNWQKKTKGPDFDWETDDTKQDLEQIKRELFGEA